MRGFAPAIRVMSRSEPPACASGSWPSMREAPVWFATTFASTCGTWLVSATSRSWAPGSIATGRRAEIGDEAVDETVPVGVGGGDRRQEPRRALEERRARVLGPARLAAGDRMAADEARSSRPRRGRPRPWWSRRRSRSRRRSPRAPPRPARRAAAIGAATTTSSAPSTASSRLAAAVDRAALDRDRERGRGRGRSRTPRRRAARAASATEAPIRPVPIRQLSCLHGVRHLQGV